MTTPRHTRRTTFLSLSAAALALIAACAETPMAEGGDVAAYEEDEAVAAPAEDSYAAVEDAEDADLEPLPAPTAPGDDYAASPEGYGDDAVGDALNGAELASGDMAPLAEGEAVAQVRDAFAAADTDGDGALSRDEYLATMTAPAATAPQDGMDASGGDIASADPAEPTAAEYLTAKFQDIAGTDEAVSLDELEDATREDFAAADTDGDAVLTGEEARTFAALQGGAPTEY